MSLFPAPRRPPQFDARPISDADLAIAARMWLAGRDTADIARVFMCREATVHRLVGAIRATARAIRAERAA